MESLEAKIKELDDNLQTLTDEFEAATNEKLRCQQEAESTQVIVKIISLDFSQKKHFQYEKSIAASNDSICLDSNIK